MIKLEPIAIVGIGCRFPGANNPNAFWQLLRNGVDAITEVPKSRWDVNKFYHCDPTHPDTMNSRCGGFLEEIDSFDPQFFGIAPREATTIDPQQRLLLEVAWEALEDGGQIPEKLAGSPTGVFIGIGTHDYSILLWQKPVNEPHATTGTGNCIAANRISYVFDLKGPSLAVDTACSSSLVAVHLACQSIWCGESSMALAGGVNVLLLPTLMVGFAKGGFLAADGRCRSFDAKASGYVRSEGAGIVVLKPLSQAQADGDRIYAVIRGSAVNQDGFSNGLAVPNPKAQSAAIREACRRAGVSPSQIQYIEAHGTGTKVGDLVEMEALGQVLAENRPPGNYCAVGSVKTNIGHLETAAGIAGLIKVALALKHQEIPPSLHFDTPNPGIDFDGIPLRVQTTLSPWSKDAFPALAGVNSFGFGGTNAHVVLTQAPDEAVLQDASQSQSQPPLYLFTISAKSDRALHELAQSYQEFTTSKSEISLADLCFTANNRRSHFNHRLAVVADSIIDLREQLAAFILGKETTKVFSHQVSPKQSLNIAFLFTGQGSQYLGMGRQLYETELTFRQTLNRCDDILRPGLDRSLLEVLYPSCQTSTLLDETGYTQPALFALEYALAQLWISWGINPQAVMGHSVGEYVAACLAGVFSLEDGLKLIAARGRLMQSLPKNGAMAAIFAPESQVWAVIEPYLQVVAIAAINSPENIVISGNDEKLAHIISELAVKDIKSTKLNVSHAFHSPLMEPILAEFGKIARQITYSLPQIDLISNVTGELISDEIATPEYWCQHIQQPVKFARSIATLDSLGCEAFIEIGAKPILLGMGRECLGASPKLYLPSLRFGCTDWQQMLGSLAQLYVRGAKINCSSSDRHTSGHLLQLPTYPFQRQRFWWSGAKLNSDSTSRQLENRVEEHPLLGRKLNLAGTQEIRYTSQISQDSPSYLQDHCVSGQAILPATAYLEMVLAAAHNIFDSDSFSLQEFVIQKPLFLSKDEIKNLQLVLVPEGQLGYSFEVFSSTNSSDCFTLQASGKIASSQAEDFSKKVFSRFNLARLKTDFAGDRISIQDYYEQLTEQGLEYGTTFQGIKQLWQQERQALAQIELSEILLEQTADYQFHPVLLDACLQVIGAALPKNSQGMNLPARVDKLEVYHHLGRSLWSYVRVLDAEFSPQKPIKADLYLFNETGDLIAQIEGLSLQYISHQSWQKLLPQSVNLTDWLYQVTWEPKSRNDKLLTKASSVKTWLIFADKNGMSKNLGKKLKAQGDRSILVFSDRVYKKVNSQHYCVNPIRPEDFQRLLQDITKEHQSSCWGVIHLWSLDNSKNPEINLTTLSATQAKNCGSLLHLVQSLTQIQWSRFPDLWLVTQNTQAVAKISPLVKVEQAALWGLGRVITLEHPELNCRCLDLETVADESQIIAEFNDPDLENQIAYRQGVRYVSRLTRCSAQSPKTPVQLQISDYGVLDNLTLAPATRRLPKPEEVEIQVCVAGVNFRDVLNALGMLKEYLEQMGFSDAAEIPFGGECAGKIVAVGEGVSGLKIGDEVIAAPAIGSMSSFVTVNSHFVVLKPSKLSFAEAATIPTAFMTAYYGLQHLAKIKAGYRILIHAAAGGVGQAAVQLAQKAGAEVFVTASPGKWDFLKSVGVKHLMNSRNLDFAGELLQLTDGEGVDLILNSLNGEFIPKSLDVLAPGGRFVEIGKIGVWNEIQIQKYRADISYFHFDLLEISQEKPKLIALMLEKLVDECQNGGFSALPHQIYPIEETAIAFRQMAHGKHIGKIALSLPKISSIEPIVREDSTYLITGGLGALGLQVANWLVERGAKHLVLARRSAASSTSQGMIDRMEKAGVEVSVVVADISNPADVTRLITPYHQRLRGIIHAAGIIDDGVLQNLSWKRFEQVMAPKVAGTWNLHLATQDLPLDFFVCFSSITSVLGSLGQGNYSAANAFMDAFACYRRSLGLPGLSINWGAWASAGMAAELTAKNQLRLAQQGWEVIAPQQGLQILAKLLAENATGVCVLPVDWSTFGEQLPQGMGSGFWEGIKPLSNPKKDHNTEFRQDLEVVTDRERYSVVFNHIRDAIAKVLGFTASELIDPQQNFSELGMDSLMAVELKNSLQTSLGISMAQTVAFDYPTVELLANYLAKAVLDVDPLGIETPEILAAAATPQSEISPVTTTPLPSIPPAFYQFALMPEYLNLRQDLDRVEQLGNPFFRAYETTARDTIQIQGRELINYASYNYLGMSGEFKVSQAAQAAIERYGTSVSASRLISGEIPLHQELEREIADFIGTEACIVYIGGHPTNVTTIGHLFGNKDLLLYDALSHNSIRQGCILSGATAMEFPHNDWQSLEQILSQHRHQYEKVLIAIEGIYSTDGDIAPLPEIIRVKNHYKALLMVDEAHSMGVIGSSGRGIGEYFQIARADVDLWMGTLSKSFASCGGYIAGCQELVAYLKYTAPGFVFSVGMSPANTAAALAALRLLRAEPERVAKLSDRAKLFLDLAKSKEFNTGDSKDSPIIPIIVGEPYKAVQLSKILFQRGINVQPMVYPSVPYNASRLRFFMSSLHAPAQIHSTLEVLAQEIIKII
jgi:8-amino-7-oxononanoate synthase